MGAGEGLYATTLYAVPHWGALYLTPKKDRASIPHPKKILLTPVKNPIA